MQLKSLHSDLQSVKCYTFSHNRITVAIKWQVVWFARGSDRSDADLGLGRVFDLDADRVTVLGQATLTVCRQGASTGFTSGATVSIDELRAIVYWSADTDEMDGTEGSRAMLRRMVTRLAELADTLRERLTTVEDPAINDRT